MTMKKVVAYTEEFRPTASIAVPVHSSAIKSWVLSDDVLKDRAMLVKLGIDYPEADFFKNDTLKRYGAITAKDVDPLTELSIASNARAYVFAGDIHRMKQHYQMMVVVILNVSMEGNAANLTDHRHTQNLNRYISAINNGIDMQPTTTRSDARQAAHAALNEVVAEVNSLFPNLNLRIYENSSLTQLDPLKFFVDGLKSEYEKDIANSLAKVVDPEAAKAIVVQLIQQAKKLAVDSEEESVRTEFLYKLNEMNRTIIAMESHRDEGPFIDTKVAAMAKDYIRQARSAVTADDLANPMKALDDLLATWAPK